MQVTIIVTTEGIIVSSGDHSCIACAGEEYETTNGAEIDVKKVICAVSYDTSTKELIQQYLAPMLDIGKEGFEHVNSAIISAHEDASFEKDINELLKDIKGVKHSGDAGSGG